MTEDTPENDPHSKQTVFQEWMQGDHIVIHCDSRDTRVMVPEKLKGVPALPLKLSYKFQGTTSTTDTTIVSNLKFDGDYFECIIPWTTIWGITSEHGTQKIWLDSLPLELVSSLALQKLAELGATVIIPDESGAYQPITAATLMAANQTPPPSAPAPKRTTLKRVK